MEMKNHILTKKCPRRPYGCQVYPGNDNQSKRLADSVPIVGLGCSSFSTAYLKKEQKVAFDSWEGNHKDDDDGIVSKNHVKVKEWIATIHHAILNCGINLLDTAPWYGDGMSEVVIGYALEDLLNGQAAGGSVIKREDIIINTKVGRYKELPLVQQFDFSYDRVLSSVQLSLQRMKCDYIDVLQLHDPEFSPSISLLLEETIPAMIECRDKHHWVKAIGITGYPLDVQYEILRRSHEIKIPNDIAKHNNKNFIIFDQSLTYCHCNLFDSSLFSPSYQNNHSSFADYCQRHQIHMMAAAPLAMGLLTPSGPPDWHPASTLLKQACAEASKIVHQNHTDINIASLATFYALAHQSIACTLIGCSSIQEVDRALQAALRFDNDNNKAMTKEQHPLSLLKQILSASEWDTLQLILDPQNGPFAKVWETDEYDWDGKRIAQDFWKQVPGGSIKAESTMRERK